MNNRAMERVEAHLHEIGGDKGPCHRAFNSQMKAALVLGKDQYDISKIDMRMQKGMKMEQATEMMKNAGVEMTEAKADLAKFADEIIGSVDGVNEVLLNRIKEFRSTRMAIATEARESLGALKDVRNFFMDKDYDTEMARLERLVKVCRELHELKTSGILDAVLDSALRLAVER